MPHPPVHPRIRLMSLIAALGATAAFTAQAQTAPPIKPGLWQVQSEREINGQKAPDPMEQFKNLPPEARKQMEAMMKQRGVDMSQTGGLQKICHTRESLDKGRWKDDSERCKADITSRSAAAWKWRAVCTQPDAEMDGEAVFTSPENYTVKTLMTSQRGGKPQTMRMTMTARWVAADCGTLKPIQPPPPTK
jgi:Protein of unknown function (DUF3617)